MSLEQDIMTALKDAMKSKDQTALTALRAVKSAILLAQTENGSKEALTEEQELKILQKQVKQRRDSAAVYLDQGRKDLDRKSTRLNPSHVRISYAVFCLKKKTVSAAV